MTSPPRTRDTSRVEGFSDGVFSIAITLLVLDLRDPPGAAPGGLLAALGHDWPTYAAYLASFAYVGVIWVNHHWLFARILTVDRGVLWWNLVILLATATLPFPTALLAAHLTGPRRDAVGAVAVYACVVALRSAAWNALNRYLLRHPHLLEPGVDPARYRRRELPRALVGIGLALLAVAVAAALHPYAALAVFGVQTLFYALTSEGLPLRPGGDTPGEGSRRP